MLTDELSEQARIRCVIQRGGTSKGLFFHEEDLPRPGPQRDRLLQRLMGSPDVLQIDGLGGSRPITSKVAIVSRSTRDDADVDYTFAQIEIERDLVVYDGNCGNISSGVGPFAIDEGLVSAIEGTTRVRIYNTNTKKVMVADVPVHRGKAKVEGDFAIPGVPGTGAEIAMNWSATVGSNSGRLLPTTHPVDTIVLDNGESVEITICDAANVVVFARASALGLEGSELSDAISGNPALLEKCREVRGRAAMLLGVCKDWRDIDRRAAGLMLGLVSAPKSYTTLSGGDVAESDMDLRVRLMFMQRLHETIAGTGSICLAAASRVPGSVVAAVTRTANEHELRIGHPSGVTPASVTAKTTETAPFVEFENLGFSRTSRRLMDCMAYYPRSLLSGLESEA